MKRRTRKGKVLAVKLGSNPNSSSLGIDVTMLLGGGALVSLLGLVGGTLARWVLRGKKTENGQMD